MAAITSTSVLGAAITGAFGTACGSLQTTFDLCSRNSLYSSNGVQYKDALGFCASLQGQQEAYYQCLCNQTNMIIACFNTACSGDTSGSFASFIGNQKSYCLAATQFSPIPTSSAAAPLTFSSSSVAAVLSRSAVTSGPIVVQAATTTTSSSNGRAVAAQVSTVNVDAVAMPSVPEVSSANTLIAPSISKKSSAWIVAATLTTSLILFMSL
ncbi:hypothetical protein BC830DRAFT_1092403 [Chytriomyces sp. MP71]|nr:hypothetical protein BC830DRAFT_1092403 [Chytriomyces sp. MP71]